MTSRPRSKPRAHVVGLVALALFCAAFAMLVYQLRTGRDPALGRGTTPVSAPAVRHVLVRKVILTRVVVHLPSEDGGATRTTTVPVIATVPASSTSTAGTTVAPAAPAAPAPAPLTTRTS